VTPTIGNVGFRLNFATAKHNRCLKKMDRIYQNPWYVVVVRANFERVSSLRFQEKGYETYLPLYRARRKWSDRSKEVEVPLFAGYTFCRFDADHRLPILQTPGVKSIVGTKTTGPIPVDETEINAVRAMLDSELPVGPWPFLGEGNFVTVERGPLAGVEGIVVEVKNNFRLVVSVSLLQRSVYAEIDRDWVVPRTAIAQPLVKQTSYSACH
jgi:transcription antitermination factor NusG